MAVIQFERLNSRRFGLRKPRILKRQRQVSPVATGRGRLDLLSWLRRGRRDQLLVALGWTWSAWRWARDGSVKQRLAEVEVPNGILLTTMFALVAANRLRDRAWNRPGASPRRATRALTMRIDDRTEELLALKSSVESLVLESSERERHIVTLDQTVGRLTTWLLRLTIALAVITAAGIAATVVAIAA